MPDPAPIHRAVTFIDARLREDLTIADISAAAGYSTYHFIRAFNEIVRHTPYDYLMRRRLSEAARELIASKRRVLEIAIEYRFKNHETFSRAFRRMFGMQPIQWRSRGRIARSALMPPISRAYLDHLARPGFGRPRRLTCPERRLAGLMTRASDSPGFADEQWICLQQVAGFAEMDDRRRDYYLIYSYPGEPGDRGYCLAGYGLDLLELPGPVLVCQVLPAGEYISMTHPAGLETLPLTMAFLYHTFLPRAALTPAWPVEVLSIGAAPARSGGCGEIEILLPVRPADQASGALAVGA